MGAWAELDANYPPGALTPAAALIVALGRLAGARSVYAAGGAGPLAAFLPRRGLAYDQDLLERAERYLREIPDEQFLAEAGALLSPQQRLCLAYNLLDAALGDDADAPWRHAYLSQAVEALGLTAEQLRPARQVLALKQRLELFPQ